MKKVKRNKMKRFDSSKWITENKHGNSFDQELTTIFTEVFIQSSLPKGILKENLSLQLEAKISDVIKGKVNTLPSDVKGELKAFQQSLKDDGINFLEYLKSAARAFKGVTEEELPALLASLEADGKLDEAVIEVNSIEDLKKLKTIGADTFTWNKETTSLPSGEFSVNGNPNNKQELIKGNSYTLVSRDLGELKPGETDFRGIGLQNNAAKEEVSKFKGFIEKTKKRTKTNAGIALTILGLMVPQMFGNTANTVIDKIFDGDKTEYVDAVKSDFNVDTDASFEQAQKELTTGGGGTDIAQVLNIAGGDNPGAAGVEGDFTNDENSIVTGGKFKVGEYELSDSEKNTFVDQAFGALASLMDKQIGDSDTKKLTVNSKVTLDYSGYVSNSGDKANEANDGSDLQKGRTETAKEIATAVKTKIDKYQQDTYGKIIIDVELNEIDNSDFENQSDQEATDYLATQGFKVKTNVNLDFDESGEPIKLVQNDFEYAQYDVAGSGGPSGKTVGGTAGSGGASGTGGTGDTAQPSKKDTKVVQPKEKDDEEIIKGSRRNDQWAFILQKLNPQETDFYALLAKDPDTFNKLRPKDQERLKTGGNQEIFDNALNTIVQNTKDEKLKDVSNLILYLRKNPDYLLNKINSFYSDDKQPLNKRAKSKSKFGKFTKGTTTAESLYKEMYGYNVINENRALWNKLVGDDLMKQNLDWLIPAAASIWGGKGSTNDQVLDIINKNNVDQKTLDMIKKSFGTTGKAGDKYDFLPDVDRIAKYMDKNPQNIEVKIDAIGTKTEFDEFVTAIINRFDPQYIVKGEVPGILTQIANDLPKDVKENVNEISVDAEKVDAILNLPAVKNLLDKVNSKQEFIETLGFFIFKIEGIKNSMKKSYLNSLASNYRSQQQDPDFKDKEKSGDDIYVANPKESFKSLAQQLGYIK